MTNKYNSILYVGITNNLDRRASEHKFKTNRSSFTAKYNINKLVYYEVFNDPNAAIDREKKIKAGSRLKKLQLVNEFNPEWKDLSIEE